MFSTPLPIAGTVLNSIGAFATSSSVNKNGRIVACGHTKLQIPHWIQFSGCQVGTCTAIVRFSSNATLLRIDPSNKKSPVNADTGISYPSRPLITATWLSKYSSPVNLRVESNGSSAQAGSTVTSTIPSLPASIAL